MDEVKRLNYFNSQFLVAKDFNDEQSYHRNLRQLHNQLLHSWGIAKGLEVKPVSGNARQISVSPGVAIDHNGQEIVLPDNPPPANIDLTPAGAATSVTVAITYQTFFDAADRYRDNTNYVRATERPKIIIFGSGENRDVSEQLEFSTASSPTDGSVVQLARVSLENGNVSAIIGDASIRKTVSATIASGAVSTEQLAPAVQSIVNASITSINNVSVNGADVSGRNLDLIAANAITITPDAANKRIQLGENHSARTNNPHQTTAAQIDAQGGANQIVARINAGTGVIADARLDPAIARDSEVNARFDPATGHDHDGTNSKRIAPNALAGVNPTVTAASLNTLTAGSGTDASSLHFHDTMPTVTRRYHIPMAPVKIGTSREFEANLTRIRALPTEAAVGRILLSLPNGAQLTQLSIDTSTTPATSSGGPNNFILSAQIQLIPSVNGAAIINVTNQISINSPSRRDTALSHVVNTSSGTYWLVLTVLTAAPAGIEISGITVDYTLNRLF